jgi:hypothetical protein
VITRAEVEKLGALHAVERLLSSAPPAVREAVAGSFTADPRALTAAGVRDLAAPVVARWADLRARRLAAEIMALPPGGHCAVGLPVDACCPDWGTAALVMPDVIEEMVSRILEDGGEVVVTGDDSFPVAARLILP